jgi:murein DD-endopeptidase MepM/ murein hydrolase activator NlpD
MAEPLVPGQRKFAAALAGYTGLDPRVIGAWLKSEQSGSAASNYERRGYYDWLNIANTDSGPASGAHSSAWRDPISAAKATAEWMRGQGQIAREYGKPAPGITAILRTAGKSPQAQINAIGASGWATAPDYGSKIGALYGELGGLHLQPTAAAHAVAAGTIASEIAPHLEQAGPNANQSADLVSLLQQTLGAQQRPASAPATPLRRPQSAGGEEPAPGTPRVPQAAQEAPQQNNPAAILSVLSRLAADASPEGVSEAGTHHMQAYEESGGTASGYVNPLPGFVKGRTDQGVDYSAHPGAPIRAIGDGIVLPGQSNWFQGQPYVQYRLTSGPQKGKVVFVAEQIAPQVRPGQRIHAGQRIGVYAPHGTAIETGFGSGQPGVPLTPYNGAPDGTETAGGKQARQFLERLGAR